MNEVIYGYGFPVISSSESLRRFALNHKDTVKELAEGKNLLKWAKTEPEASIYEAFDDWENEQTEQEGINGLIADVMGRETGIRFEYHADHEGRKEYILFPTLYPWQLNEDEKNLTTSNLESIIKVYGKEFGNFFRPDDIRIEFS